ncbi:hypothetical protein CK203_007857 [Vitis vinifera]|uniref:Uncharacterized protein n=1 Tax=Vitis vinifera TaxID=29760 RepID=A0A438K1M5_VITVI|nr:hypothetical protein CK203_007857 [Vitis vinifera]
MEVKFQCSSCAVSSRTKFWSRLRFAVVFEVSSGSVTFAVGNGDLGFYFVSREFMEGWELGSMDLGFGLSQHQCSDLLTFKDFWGHPLRIACYLWFLLRLASLLEFKYFSSGLIVASKSSSI